MNLYSPLKSGISKNLLKMKVSSDPKRNVINFFNKEKNNLNSVS